MLRRNFIKLSATAFAAAVYSPITYAATTGTALVNHPDEVWAQLNNEWVKLTGNGTVYTYKDIIVTLRAGSNAQSVCQFEMAQRFHLLFEVVFGNSRQALT